MAWHRKAPSHYLNQCWSDSLTHICGTRGSGELLNSESRTLFGDWLRLFQWFTPGDGRAPSGASLGCETVYHWLWWICLLSDVTHVVNGLVPICRHGICNHHDDVGRPVHDLTECWKTYNSIMIKESRENTWCYNATTPIAHNTAVTK